MVVSNQPLPPQERKEKKGIDLYLLILISLGGWVIAWLSGSPVFADFAALIGVILVGRWIWSIWGIPSKMLRFVELSAAMLCLLQNTAWLTASFTHRFVLHLNIEDSIRDTMVGGLRFESYCLAIIYVTLFSAFLAYASSRKFFAGATTVVIEAVAKIRRIRVPVVINILLFLIGAEILFIALGIIGQRTMVIEGAKEGEQSFLVSLFTMCTPIQVILNALLLSKLTGKAKMRSSFIPWVIFITSMALSLFLYFNQGRSGLVFSVISLGFWYYLFLEIKPKLWKLALGFAIVYPIITQVLLFSNFVRSANAGLDTWKSSAIEVLPVAWERFTSNAQFQVEEQARSTKNISTRPLVSVPLAHCMQALPGNKDFTMGEHILNSIVWIIPGPIFPNKTEYPIQEALLYKHFKIGDTDTSDSLYLYAYTEFGWAGFIIYPALLLALWLLVCRMLRTVKSSVLCSMIILTNFFQLFIFNIAEGSITMWLTVFRVAVFVFVLYHLVALFVPRRIMIPEKQLDPAAG